MKINGASLQTIRERSGLTQSDLARSTGVSQNRISTIESTDANVRPQTAKALAESLGCPVTAILISAIPAIEAQAS